MTSASERLRALDGELGLSKGYFHALHIYRDALPLIADVVEAAERFTAAVDGSIALGIQPALSPATAERVQLDELLRPALTALRDALEEK